MKQRQFLQSLNIWGATLVSHGDELLHYTIPCLLKYCDSVLLMRDNVSEKTKKIINEYKNKYPNRIKLAESGFPPLTSEKQENHPQGYLRRWKGIQGNVREKVFEYLREVHKKEKIDILIFPDEDEVFSDYLPELLEDFWSREAMKGITIKPIDVYGDMQTITDRSMTGHTRILKFFPELTGLNYRTGCYYRPLTKRDRMGCKFYTIHLCNLQTDRFDWRVNHWKKGPKMDWGLWRLSKDVRQIKPEEIKQIIKREQDCTVEEYLAGGGAKGARVPMGLNNADKALREASDLLDKLGVIHFLAFGTLLGIYRDGKQLKWDWDIDLISLAEDNKKIEDNLDKISEAGFTHFKRKQDIPKWKKEDGAVSEEKYVRTYSFMKYNCRIDIDPAYISADEKSRLILKGRKREYLAACHPAAWFDPTYNVLKYNGKIYYIPSDVEEYFKSNYGDDWRTPVKEHRKWHRRACRVDTYEIK